jgi:Tfp pilus assembly protein PilX
VLNSLPLTDYEQVAIVEAWADLKDQPTDVLPALRREACETGADALVVIDSSHQDIKNLLYRATPNEAQTDMDSKSGTASSGQYIQEAEHTRRMGEAGHNGFYIDAVAINYHAGSGKGAGPMENPSMGTPPS